jgi:hypothetical protein
MDGPAVASWIEVYRLGLKLDGFKPWSWETAASRVYLGIRAIVPASRMIGHPAMSTRIPKATNSDTKLGFSR